MRHLWAVCLSLLICLPSAAQEDFNSLFAAYQEAVAQGDRYKGLRLAKQVYEAAQDQSDLTRAITAFNYGYFLLLNQENQQSVDLLEQAAKGFEDIGDAGLDQAINAHNHLVIAYGRLGETEKAVKMARKSEKLYLSKSQQDLLERLGYGLAVAEAEFLNGSLSRTRKKIKALRKDLPPNLPADLSRRLDYQEALVHLARRKEEEAIPLLERMVEGFAAEERFDDPLAGKAAAHLHYATLTTASTKTRGSVKQVAEESQWWQFTDSCACDHLDTGHVVLLKKRPPNYPEAMRRRSIEGVVLVEYAVGPDGKAQDPFVVEAVPNSPEFREAALESAATFEYEPPLENGKPVRVSKVLNLFTFKLRR